MDSTRTTADQLTPAQAQQAYQAWKEGRNASWIAAQFNCYEADMRKFLEEMDSRARIEESRRRKEAERKAEVQRRASQSVPDRLNDAIFDAIDSLKDAMASGDPERIDLEIRRAGAVEGLANTAIRSMGVQIEAVRVASTLSEGPAAMPRNLLPS